MLKKIFPALLAVLCSSRYRHRRPLRIAAAADLQPVLRRSSNSSKGYGDSCRGTYQASAALTAQIQNGGPFDLFFVGGFELSQAADRCRACGCGGHGGFIDADHPMPKARWCCGRARMRICQRLRSTCCAARNSSGWRLPIPIVPVWAGGGGGAQQPQALRLPEATFGDG